MLDAPGSEMDMPFQQLVLATTQFFFLDSELEVRGILVSKTDWSPPLS